MGIDYIKKHFPSLGEELANEIICEEILSDKVCHDLREAAKKFKIKAEEIDKLVREALDKKLRKAKDIIHGIRTKIVDMATNFKCTDALSESVCAKIKEIAAKFKVDYQKVMKLIKDIIAKGKEKAQEIIDYVHKRMVDLSKVKCTDVLSESLCTKIKAFAEAFKIKYAKIIEVMKTAIAKGLDKISEIIDYIKKHFPHLGKELANEIICEEILSDKVCHDLREAAKKFKIKAEEIDKLVREALDKELRKAKDIIHFIRTKIVDMATNFKCT